MRLDDAVRALREETSSPSETSDETRARVLAKLEQSRGRRSKRLFVILPMAAVLAGATASAGVAGKIPGAWHSALRAFRLSSPPPNAAEPTLPMAPAPWVTPTPAVDEAEPIASAAPLPNPNPLRTRTRTSASTSTSTRNPDSLALYRNAHRLHFTVHDSSAALSAWDDYLRADPNGSLALEARYNRALCLVRLERSGEAREALAPFADGRFGGYRQSEARALLGILDGSE